MQIQLKLLQITFILGKGHNEEEQSISPKQ